MQATLVLQRLLLHNFRNYRQAEIAFGPALNLLAASNGAGKTSLLEALYLLSTGRSFRTHHLADLIHAEAQYFYLELHFTRQGVEQVLKLYYDHNVRKFCYNHSEYSQFIHLLGLLPLVLISAGDADLISGPPAQRRRFLDVHLAQRDPLYLRHLTRYQRALKQRNRLLKEQRCDGIEAWEQMMAISAVYIMQQRAALIAALLPAARSWMERICQDEAPLALSYRPALRSAPPQVAPIQALLAAARCKELQLGMTINGTHRDDLAIFLADRCARQFASAGQQRSILHALRLAERAIWTQQCDAPLLCIDDFGAHLDSARCQQLQHHLLQHGQVILTTPSADAHLDGPQKKRFTITNGRIGAL